MGDRFNGQVGGRLYEEHFGWKFIDSKYIYDDNNTEWKNNLYCIDRYFNFRPYFVFGRYIVIVGNSPVKGCGKIIDSGEEIIRINNMRNWKVDPQDDGVRTTVWAGLPIFAVGSIDADIASWESSKFIKISREVNLIWSISPFQCTKHTWNNIVSFGLNHKLKTLPGYFEYLDQIYPALSLEMRKLVWSNVSNYNYGCMPNFEILLTGVKICLACFLDGARQIDLFGFDFFTNEPYWKDHDLILNLQILILIEKEMKSTGRIFNWHEKNEVIDRLTKNDINL